MEKRVKRLTDEELIGYPIRDLVDGWFLRVDEVSQGFYKVEGIESVGKKGVSYGNRSRSIIKSL